MISTTTLYSFLVSQGFTPCKEEWDKVQALWPETIPLNEQSVMLAIEANIDLDWLVRMFPPEIRTEYLAKEKPIYSDYWAKLRPILTEYMAKDGQNEAEYEAKREPIWEDYNIKRGLLILQCLKQMLGL